MEKPLFAGENVLHEHDPKGHLPFIAAGRLCVGLGMTYTPVYVEQTCQSKQPGIYRGATFQSRREVNFLGGKVWALFGCV